MSSTTPLLRAECLTYARGDVELLRGVSLAIEPARLTLLTGAGAGTLLRVMGLLERADAGEVWFDAQGTSALDDAARLEIRNRSFGFLFAEPFLLDSFSVAENVAMPLFKISGLDLEEARVRTAKMLAFVGLGEAADECVGNLAILDHHKIALARALVNAPRVLIAEDAGLQLSGGDFAQATALLREAPRQFGVSVIATSPAGADVLMVDREVRVEDGAIAGDSNPVPLEEARP